MALITFTENIAPSRVERFEEVLKKIADAAKARKIPFKYEKKDAIEIPVADQAKGKYVRGAYQDANGVWVIPRVPFTVTHGPLDKSGFMPVAELIKMPNKEVLIKRYGLISDEQMEKLFPKINAKIQNWSPHCDHCNPKGDKRDRYYIQLLVATRDVTMKTKKGNIQFKEGDISQVGSACLDKYTDIDPKTIAELYQLERAKRIGGVRAAPNDPAGWGWKTMDLIDFLQRCVMFYGENEKEYLSRRGGLARQREGEESAKRLYSAKSEKFKVGYRTEGGTGVFPARKGVRVLQSRLITIDGQQYFQPFNLADWGVNAMIKKFENGDANACSQMPLLDENGIQEYDDAGNPIFVAVPNISAIPLRIVRKKFDKVLPLNDSVIDQANAMRKWLMRLRPADMPGKEDLVNNMKNILKFGYVGMKSANDAAEAWRYWSISTYDERVKKAKEDAEKKRQEQIRARLEQAIPNGKFRDVKEKGDITNELRNIPSYQDYRIRQLAYNRNEGVLWVTDADWSILNGMQAAKKAIQKRHQEAKDERNRRITDEGAGLRQRSTLTRLFGRVPSETDVMTVLEWNKNSEELNKILITKNWRGDIEGYYLTSAEVDKLKAHYGMGQPAPQVVPQVAPQVAPQAAQQRKPAITQTEANRKKKDSKKTSSHQGNMGEKISISGYVTMTSKVFRNRQNGYGQTIQVVSDAGDTYVIFMYNSDRPTLGQYICLDDYEIVKHNDYYGHKQTVIDSPGQPWRDCTA